MKVQGVEIPDPVIEAVRSEMLSGRGWRSSEMVALAAVVMDIETPRRQEVAMRLVDRLTQQLRKDGKIVCHRRVWRATK